MNWLESFHFLRPAWLLMLLPAALVVWSVLRRQDPARTWKQLIDPRLLEHLVVRGDAKGSRFRPVYILAAAWLTGVVALAGPAWQKLPDPSWSARDARVIALDLSSSMLAEDLRPDRLTRTRFRLADLLESTEEGQVGLISYAGDAYVVSPLTNDTNTIANLLPALQPDIMPVAGSRADLALEMAASLLARSGQPVGQVLLVTDAVDARAAARARQLRDDGIVTSVLAAGTPKGAPIPSGGGFVSDRSGNVVIARLDREALRAVAEAGGGSYTELGSAPPDAELWAAPGEAGFSRRDDALGERWKDAGPWLVLLLLPLALVGFRRGLFFVAPLVLANGLLLSPEAEAGWWEDLWLRKDQQAWQSLRSDDPQTAAALARDPSLAGEAWYRSGEYANAGEAWGTLDTADAHYNRGNALAWQGDLDGAIAAYDRALEQEPDHLDAIYNRNLVDRLKQEQEQEQQDQQGDQGESEPGDEQQESESSEQQEQEGEQDAEGVESEEEPDSEQGEPSPQELSLEETWSEEDEQAMEQWLRRIPDDPGGLLRRKFRNEHQRRGAPEDEAKSW